jgi:hypothetical protein
MLRQMVRRTLKANVWVTLSLALTGLVAAACSNSPSTPAAGSGSSTTAARLPPRQHQTGSTSTTAAAGTSTTAAAAGGTGSGTSPTLGVSSAFGPAAVGFGQVRPAEISLGGDPTGLVTGVTWQSWGGSQATGTGTSTYVGPNQSVAQGTQEMATVVASDLGTCGGNPAYQQVKWYFPQQGETLSTGANSTINACTGP